MFQQSCTYIAGELVRDRETRMKESLKIMGLNTWTYALAMLVQRTIYMIVPTVIVALWILIFLSDVYNFGEIFSMFISNFFSDYKLVGMALPAILYIPTGVSLVAVLGPFLIGEQNTWMKFLYFFPTFPFVRTMTDLLGKENEGDFYDVSVGASWFFLVI